MVLDNDEFVQRWKTAGGSSEEPLLETAWKRYTQVQSQDLASEGIDPTSNQFATSLAPLLNDSKIAPSIVKWTHMTIDCDRIPWQPTDIFLQANQVVTILASGRVWFSKLLDMYLRPQYGLWYKVGVDGEVTNSTRETCSFRVAESGGELFISTMFPGMFANPQGGRLVSNPSAYEKSEGKFEIMIIVWKNGTNVQELLSQYESTQYIEPYRSLIEGEKTRVEHEKQSEIPGWQELWFIGRSTLYKSITIDDNGEHRKCIQCKPYQNVGILQKTISPTVNFGPGCIVTWDWNISALPSRLREDTTISHDYLSVAFEFENGRDITYHPSWELPVEYGYWCPQATWEDREYHVVVRSGIEDLGKWLSERRDLYEDYQKYIGGNYVPKRIVRVWLIAGNRWQRHEGEMTVSKIRITSEDGKVEEVL
ncbi:hypothetical protein HII31_07421 [Pseudocercospora fuligena]|uniref:Uncharacterized protein n=1 Tax=Pseudocercospora fuligena TaxID=685502 RepID=A0A8H6VGE8_9PEZI|nr:hypothetical protein HII31_07421 [Pseudocercospora fuligena]